MENRLPSQPLWLRISILTYFLYFSVFLSAQNFTFNFTGSDTIFVDANCSATLDWGHPNTVSFTAASGHAIDTFYVASISGGYQIGDAIRAPRRVFIDYYVEDTTGANELLRSALRIVIADTIKPVFDLNSVPRDTGYASENDVQQPPSINTIMASDNCGIKDIFYNGESQRPTNCGTFTRSWSALDTSDNITIYTQTISIGLDAAPPTWAGTPTPLNLSCAANIDTETTINNWLNARGNASATSATTVTYSNDFTGLNGCGITGDTTVLFTATDECGKSSTVVGTIILTDTTAPTIVQEALDTTIISGSTAAITLTTWLATHGFATATDFCTMIDNTDTSTHWTVVRMDTMNTCGNNASYTATFEVKDDCGNADSTTATYAVIDTFPPTIAGLFDDTTYVCGANDVGLRIEQWFLSIRNHDLADDNGNALEFVEINYTDRDSFTGNWFTNALILDASFIPENDCMWYLDAEIIFRDDCGKAGKDTARFFLIDTIPPVLGVIPTDTTVVCGQVPAPTMDIIGTDNCDTSLTIMVSELSDTTLSAITISRTYTATDDCGNSASSTQLITVIDTIAPSLTAIPTDTMINCGEVPFAELVLFATDNCTPEEEIVFDFYEESNELEHPDSCQTYTYTITRTWIATDAFNNSDTAVQLIQVVDTIAPTFTVPTDITISCEFRDDLARTGQPTNLSDNCDTLPKYSFTDLVIGGDCIGNGVLDTIIRTWTVRDACGNSTQNTQQIILIDTTAPVITGLVADITIQCNGDIVPLPVIGTDISATDNCGNSPILQYLGETDTRGTDPNACNFYNYAITRTWRATDACGNASELAQTITITDTLAPTILCPNNLIVESEAADCGAIITLPKPFYFDDCTGTTGKDTLSITQNLTGSTDGDINEITVDTLVFNFNIRGSSPEKTIASDLSLTVHLNNVDGEGSNEIFSIIGEDGNVFAGTNSTQTQCGSSTTTITIAASLANEYAKDSIITIILSPNGNGTESINNICTGGNVNVLLEYAFEVPASSITLAYKIGNGALTNFVTKPDTTLAVGSHAVTYYATDCSGNQDSCSFQIMVTDKTAPTFSCPNPITAYTDSSSCIATVSLPFPSNFSDNCSAFNNYVRSISQLITFRNDANAGQVPNTITDTFLVENPNAIGDATLTVSFLGDNKDAGEFFTIYGENGSLIGTTSLGDSTNECRTAIITTFAVPQDSINKWAADGTILIRAVPNLDAGNFSDFINACDTTLNADLTDGNSFIAIALDYPTVTVNYTIADSTATILSTGTLQSPIIEVKDTFGLGTNEVTYSIMDAAGNAAACVFLVTVLDTIVPTIICKGNFVVNTNPSGDTTDLALFADSLIINVSDNCGVENLNVSLPKITCADIGMATVAITAIDSSGNIATCSTNVEIVIEPLEPTFSVSVCNNDVLYLFADTTFQTPTSSTATLTYSWVGPNNFNSTEANPIIQNPSSSNSGIYTLTMASDSTCIATGELFVNVSSVDAPLINTVSSTVCQSDGITLTTSAINCDSLAYQWYEIIEGVTTTDSVVLVGATTLPSFTIENPTAGRHSYYLVVQCEDCSSLGSQIITITVFDVPAAVTSMSVIDICEGETINLASPLTDQTCTYSWVGPGFTSNLPTPAPIENAIEANEGIYTLTVSKNGCTSEEAFTVVNVTNRPNKPNIANELGTITCEGAALVLKTDIATANTYTWTNTTTLATYVTTSPTFSLDTATIADAGAWTVMVETANCVSEVSEAVEVQIEAKPNGTPFFEGNACEGRMIDLNVTPTIAAASYEWKDEAGTLFLGDNPQAPVAAKYTLTITSANNCKIEKVLPIDVKATPVITTIFDSGDAKPCIIPDVTDIQLSADVFPTNDGTYAFTWTTPNGTVMPPVPDSVLTLPNVTANAVNGTYSLVVSTGDGCISDPVSTTVEVVDIPVPNPVVTANATSLCEGEMLTLMATEYSNFSAAYHWQITSLMDTITTSPILVLDSVTTALNGVVMLQVYNENCPSVGTTTLPISINTPLPKPSINADTLFCSDEPLILATNAVEGATYIWEGTNFLATSSTPEITISESASLENNDNYTVKIVANGCTSPKSAPFKVTVNQVPNAPIANNSGDICLANPTDIILFVNEENTPTESEYRWYNANNNQLVAGPTMLKSQLIEIGNLEVGTYQFFATRTINGCESAASNITELTLAEIPSELAQVCQDQMTICDASNAVICAIAPEQGIGTWFIEDPTITIENPNQAETKVEGLLPGSNYTFFWTLSNGVCGEYSKTRLTVDVSLTGSVAKVCEPLIEKCEGDEISLCANPVPTGFSGRWSQPTSQAALGVTIDNTAASNTTVSTIEPGNPYNEYTFYWTVINETGTCTASDTMTVKVYEIPDEAAQIDDTELISCNGETVVTAKMPSTGITGHWTSFDTNIGIETPNGTSTVVKNLESGMNTLVWTITSGACQDFSADEVIIFYEQAPQPMDDAFDIGFSSSATLDVIQNDQLFSPEYTLSIFSPPNNGTATVNENGTITFEANPNFVGEDLFIYELCNSTCTSECATAMVALEIGQDASCIIPTIITPNNDGINDFFTIPCLETGNFPNNEVIIYNQWGDEIYRSIPYKNDWQGTYNGENVPAGTYYYVIGFDRNTKPKAGFLIIER